MRCIRLGVIVLALLGFIPSRAVAQPQPVATPQAIPTPSELHELMVKSGYTPIPTLRKADRGNHFVRAKYGDAELTLLVDTGCGRLHLDQQVAKRLKIPFTKTTRESFGFGGKKLVQESHVRGIRIGSVELPQTSANVSDLTDLIRSVELEDGFRFDGILDSANMVYFSSVLDMAGGHLFLLDPVQKEAKLQGEWVHYFTSAAGARVLEPTSDLRVTIKGTKLLYTTDAGKTVTEYSLTLDLKANPRRMDWIAADGGTTWGIYAFDGTTLTMALPLYPTDDYKTRPTKLLSADGDKFTTLKFRPKTPAK